jgi:hypothetical protein
VAISTTAEMAARNDTAARNEIARAEMTGQSRVATLKFPLQSELRIRKNF